MGLYSTSFYEFKFAPGKDVRRENSRSFREAVHVFAVFRGSQLIANHGKILETGLVTADMWWLVMAGRSGDWRKHKAVRLGTSTAQSSPVTDNSGRFLYCVA